MTETKIGDTDTWIWHVYEIESHGMSYQVQLEGTRFPTGEKYFTEVGPELGSLDAAVAVVKLFQQSWGGRYVFHSHDDWLVEKERNDLDEGVKALIGKGYVITGQDHHTGAWEFPIHGGRSYGMVDLDERPRIGVYDATSDSPESPLMEYTTAEDALAAVALLAERSVR